MRFGSFCSGIGAPEAAWTALGWTPAFFAEIEPFPCAVLAHHYPGVPNLGDMTKITHEQIEQYAGVDVVVAGTPCQSFSVAGLRKGLDDPRGNLALVLLGLVDRLRPRWLVWENVDGVRSSGDGRDFGSFLGALGQLGYGWAYRVLDAQYGGVPQRRRRVFAVGHLGDWRRAAAVLLERESLCGNPPPSREAGAGVAYGVTTRTRGDDGKQIEWQADTAYSLLNPGAGDRSDNAMVAHTLHGSPLTQVAYDLRNGIETGDVTQTLQSHHKSNSLNAEPVVAYQCHGNNVGEMGTLRSGNGGLTGGVPFTIFSHNGCAKERHAKPTQVAAAVDSQGGYSPGQGGTVVCQETPNVHLQLRKVRPGNDRRTGPRSDRGSDGRNDSLCGVRPPEIPGTDAVPLAFQTRFARNGRGTPEEICPTLQGASAGATSDMRPCVVTPTMAVRRLTPLECERLMGFRDGYTAVPFRGKAASDGPRYRSLGNSMVTNELAWIGRRIQAVEAVR